MENLMGCEVYNKRNGTRGTVVAYDSLTITVDCTGVEMVVTYPTFKRWWIEVPKEQTEPVVEKAVVEEVVIEEPVVEQVEEVNYDLKDSERFIGTRLCNMFLKLLKDKKDDALTYNYLAKSKVYVIKYNGHNIFEVTATKKTLNVLAHPESLVPANKKRVSKMYPKEYGWALRAKFVFDTEDAGAKLVMKSIIEDGMFYRSQSRPK